MILDYLMIPQSNRQSFYQNHFFNTAGNLWSSESNAFSISIISKYPSTLLRSHISTISDINVPPSPPSKENSF